MGFDDTKNMAGRLRSGYELVRADAYPGSDYPVMNEGKYKGVIGVGGLLLATSGVLGDGGFWWHAKIGLVIALAVMHMMMGAWRKAFEEDRNTRPAKFFRIMNEVPTALMIAIVILVVVRPF